MFFADSWVAAFTADISWSKSAKACTANPMPAAIDPPSPIAASPTVSKEARDALRLHLLDEIERADAEQLRMMLRTLQSDQ